MIYVMQSQPFWAIFHKVRLHVEILKDLGVSL